MAWNAAACQFRPTTWLRYRPTTKDTITKVEAYFKLLPRRIKSKRYEKALQKAFEDFRLPSKVRPFHINDSIKFFQHPDRSPGLPYTTQGFRRKDEVPPNTIKHYVHNLKYGIYSKCTTPCNAVTKSIVARKPKFRLIWVYPSHMTFAEGMFAQPLIKAYQQKEGVYALHVNYSRGHLQRIMSLRPENYRWLALDYSSFDARVPAWLIRDAFSILREQIDFANYEFWGHPTDPDTLPRLWNRIVKYFIDTPIKLPSGEVKVKHQGVPSGSFFTSLVNSVCNCIMMHYLLDDVEYSRNAFWVLGDDCLVAIKGTVSLSDMERDASEVFGAIINPDKSEIGEFVSFLGYKMGGDRRPLASYEKLMAQLLLPEGRDQSMDDFIARTKALQLSCFGLGCLRFWHETQLFLDSLGVGDDPPLIHRKSDIYRKLEQLDLADFPPLRLVACRI